MNVFKLINAINDVVAFKPGYKLSAIDWSRRHAGSILVRVTYRTFDYSAAYAPNYGNFTELEISWYFCIVPEHYDNERGFWRGFFDNLMRLETHENREAFRIFNPDTDKWEGPFNPHEPSGQKSFGSIAEDIQFGDLVINPEDVEVLFD